MKSTLYRIVFAVIVFTGQGQTLGDTPSQCFDDWVVSSETHSLCGGYYKEAPPPFPAASPAFLEQQPITVTSTQAEFQEEGTTTLQGQVHLIQGNRQVFTEQAVICRDLNTKKVSSIKTIGNVKVLEPGRRLEGTDAEINIAEDRYRINHAQYRIYDRHARGEADAIQAFGKNRFILSNASYTTCNPFQNTWELRARKVDLNKITGRGQAYHARMYAKDIPIFYFPYVNFPIDDRRQTGFLFPNVGASNLSGLEIATPFYWNIAPNYDATLTPRLLGKRGVDLGGQFRYLIPCSQGQLQANYLPFDRAYRGFRNQTLLNPAYPRNDPRVQALTKGNNARRAFLGKHQTALNANWSANVNYQVVGDDNYFMDLGNSLGTAGTTQLLQQGDVNYQDDYWKGQARVQSYQTLHPYYGPVNSDPYQRLPQLAFKHFYPDLPHCFEWTGQGMYTYFTHRKNPFTSAPFTTGSRFYARPALAYPIVRHWGFFKPRIQLDMLSYQLALSPSDIQNGQPRHPNRTLPMVDMDTGLIFERPFSFLSTPFTQTLEPRAYYLYVPYRNQNNLPNFDTAQMGFDFNQLYRDNRFAGVDRLGDANQVTLGLTSRFLCQPSGNERLYLSVGQIYSFRERKVTAGNSFLSPQVLEQEIPDRKRKRSPLAGLGRLQLISCWYANAAFEWDTYRHRTDKTAVWLQYQPEELSVFNVGYQYLRRNPAQLNPRTSLPEKVQQIDASTAWALTEHWRILARSNYDFQNHRMNEILYGIEYQGCCTAVRLSGVRYILPNNGQRSRYASGIFFQFVFKGLASVGHNRVNSILSKSIPGYQWRRDNF